MSNSDRDNEPPLPSSASTEVVASAQASCRALEPLIKFTRDSTFEGRLLESWEINDDSTEFVFHLREGATWHSGREFTSDDVRYIQDSLGNVLQNLALGAVLTADADAKRLALGDGNRHL